MTATSIPNALDAIYRGQTNVAVKAKEVDLSLTELAALDAASQEHIYDFACSFLYDNWDEYSLKQCAQQKHRRTTHDSQRTTGSYPVPS
tara:strand:+ start:1076 stop:1342 length:267 start_codon:yes stop_codon:yes gene_type:complete